MEASLMCCLQCEHTVQHECRIEIARHHMEQEVHGQKGTHPNRGTTADVVTGLSIALAFRWLRNASTRHIRGSDNALQVAAQLAPIGPTGDFAKECGCLADCHRCNSGIAGPGANHTLSRRPHFSHLNGCFFRWYSLGRIHTRAGIILGFDIH
jgi:hypothetical protein